ncbi:MAG TPA: indolepyruvate ferredoxin oxidoreductase subunit alpha, partial [Candidatus Bathyarchaeota archaeon]|nr:indolepyruvate ferredoxin oxidoreductase subunit alpha [Candidatus Bathyarchaeota archaeon]
RELAESTDLNYVAREGSGLGIVTAGAAFNYTIEALDVLGVNASVLKLGMVHPFPSKLVADFAAKHDAVLVVEELEPYLELNVRAALHAHGVGTPVYGKAFVELLPRHGELSTRAVIKALCELTGVKPPADFAAVDERVKGASELLPPRPPVLCPGCPHRASFFVIKRVVGAEGICTTDIGCYALGIQPPLEVGDFLICMGASVGAACGISKALKKRVVAVVGDSTFFHAAIPALINAVYNRHQVTVVVLDNLTTAMTGHQPHPGMGITGTGEPGKRVLIEEVARGCGVEHVFVVDPFDLKEATKVFKEAVSVDGPSVVVFRQVCRLLAVREARRKGVELPKYEVTEDCTRCGVCVKAFGCPAFYVAEDGSIHIDEELCTGCGVCSQVCPYGAIREVGSRA